MIDKAHVLSLLNTRETRHDGQTIHLLTSWTADQTNSVVDSEVPELNARAEWSTGQIRESESRDVSQWYSSVSESSP